ncbi:MAG: SRPBCC family protein [Spongiibacteraceae bacterium]|jgi:carbon monoxide dehydrogenase subunit G|nr:SRPBCC family protein [Spongiibacteraceae bacterium]
MIEVTVERDLDAPLARVWALLEDFGNLDWFPGWTRIDVIGSGVGMLRRIHMEGMDPIDEKLESLDPAARTFSYSIPNIPMPVTDYRADVRVTGTDNGCRIIWRCQAKPAGIPAADAKAMLEGVYSDMISKLEAAARN